MNLVIDIGNTRIKTALYTDDTLISNHRFDVESFTQWIAKITYKRCIISSVADVNQTKKIKNLTHDALELSYLTKIPIINNYATPKTLGNDRLANAIAAYRLLPNNNTLIIDAGTCLKFDFINDKNEYLGGAIAPGLKMRFEAVHTFTDKLPFISDFDKVDLIGTDTTTSIISGCLNGFVFEVEQTIRQYASKYDNLKVILTGGDVEILEKMDFSQKNSIFADRCLTLSGLNEILKHNVEK